MRERWIDYSKALGMLFIVWGHINYVDNEFINNFFSYGKVVIFYMVAGAIFRQKEKSEFRVYFLKKTKSLFFPYLYFSLLATLVSFLFNSFVAHKFVVSNIYDNLVKTILLRGIDTLWFLPTLFIGEILLYVVDANRMLKKILIFIIPILFYVSFVLFKLDNIIVVKCLISFWFLLIGNLLFEFFNLLKLSENNKKIGLLLVLFLGHLIILFVNGHVDLNNLVLGNNVLLYFIGSFLNGLILIILSMLISNIGSIALLDFYGKQSLFIMGTHTALLILPVIEHIILKIMGKAELSMHYYLSCLVIFIVISIVEYIIWVSAKKIKNFFFDNRKKRRNI